MEFVTAFGGFFIVLLMLILGFFPLLALISILKNKFPNNDKLIWVLVVLVLPFFGTILYFIIGRPKVKAYENRNSN